MQKNLFILYEQIVGSDISKKRTFYMFLTLFCSENEMLMMPEVGVKVEKATVFFHGSQMTLNNLTSWLPVAALSLHIALESNSIDLNFSALYSVSVFSVKEHLRNVNDTF